MPCALEDVAFHRRYVDGEVDCIRLDIDSERAHDGNWQIGIPKWYKR